MEQERCWHALLGGHRGKRTTGRMHNMMTRKDGTHGAGSLQGEAADPLGVNSEIGRKLRQYYNELVSDEVPDRFAQLLAQLERAEPAQSNKQRED